MSDILYSKLRLEVPLTLNGENATITSERGNSRVVQMSSPITDIMLAGMEKYRIQAGAVDEFMSFGYGEIKKKKIYIRQLLKKLPYRFGSGAAVVLNNEIHILGGYGNENKTKHYKWNGTDWVSVSTLPYQFNTSKAVVLNNEIHILGGGNSSDYKKHYKWNGTEWISVSTLPYELSDGVAVVLNNEIHILGSNYYTGTPPNQTYTHKRKHYAWNGTSWSSKSAPNFDIIYSEIGTAFNNEIHIFSRPYTSITTYHRKWDGSSWTYVGQFNGYDAYGAQAVVYGNKIHLLGGLNSDTLHYIWDGTNYSPLNSLPYRFEFGSAVVWDSGMGNEIAIIGTNETNYGTYDAQWDGTSWTVGED